MGVSSCSAGQALVVLSSCRFGLSANLQKARRMWVCFYGCGQCPASAVLRAVLLWSDFSKAWCVAGILQTVAAMQTFWISQDEVCIASTCRMYSLSKTVWHTVWRTIRRVYESTAATGQQSRPAALHLRSGLKLCRSCSAARCWECRSHCGAAHKSCCGPVVVPQHTYIVRPYTTAVACCMVLISLFPT